MSTCSNESMEGCYAHDDLDLRRELDKILGEVDFDDFDVIACGFEHFNFEESIQRLKQIASETSMTHVEKAKWFSADDPDRLSSRYESIAATEEELDEVTEDFCPNCGMRIGYRDLTIPHTCGISGR